MLCRSLPRRRAAQTSSRPETSATTPSRYAIPLSCYADIIRGIFLRGSGLGVLWPEAAILALTGLGILTLASFRFRKRFD